VAVPDHWEPPGHDAQDLIGAAALAVLADPAELLKLVDIAVLEASPVLSEYEELVAQTQATNHANVMRWVSSTARRPGEPIGHDLTPEALEIARDVVRRGIDREALWTGYRHGENVVWRYWMKRLTQLASTSPTWSAALPEALDATARSLFAFVDAILVEVDARIAAERDQLLPGNQARRIETVRLILEDAPITQRRASERLGYELAGAHLAMVLWTADTEAGPSLLEDLVLRLARAGGLRPPFSVPAGPTRLWAWAAAPDPPDSTAMNAILDRGSVHVTIGSRAPGIAGFRRSHREAADVHRLVVRQRAPQPLTTYEEVAVVVLAGADPDRAGAFVRTALGGLFDARPELREALRAHLLEHRSATRAARRLFTHRNTVLSRVKSAEALLPRPLDEHPLAVALALELDHWLDFTSPTSTNPRAVGESQPPLA
jgi:DNA-binding PucR family transcriptional regulator